MLNDFNINFQFITYYDNHLFVQLCIKTPFLVENVINDVVTI